MGPERDLISIVLPGASPSERVTVDVAYNAGLIFSVKGGKGNSSGDGVRETSAEVGETSSGEVSL